MTLYPKSPNRPPGDFYSQIGLITLVGLIAKNGILIVAFANELQERGQSKVAAVREAAITRLRPILMTTAATVFGHLPLVFVTGAGAEARNSIGIMLVSGMAIGTLFTLLILPVIYLVIACEHRPRAAEEDVDMSKVKPAAACVDPVYLHCGGQPQKLRPPSSALWQAADSSPAGVRIRCGRIVLSR